MAEYYVQRHAAAALPNDSNYDGFPQACTRHRGDALIVYRANATQHNLDTSEVGSQIYNGSWSGESVLVSASAGWDVQRPCLLRLTTQDHLLLVYQQVNVAAGHSNQNQVWIQRSEDDGDTWLPPVQLIYSGTTDGYMIVCCNPIQLANGRILLPAYMSDSGDQYSQAHVWYSDDSGDTWNHLSQVDPGNAYPGTMSEPSLTLLSNGDIVCLTRNQLPSKHEVVRSVSVDSGVTWSTPTAWFQAGGAPDTTRYNGRTYMLNRDSDDLLVWVLFFDDDNWSTAPINGPWQFRETDPSGGILNYGNFFEYQGEFYAVWAEQQTSSDSDLYFCKIAKETTDGDVLNADSFDRPDSTDIGVCDGMGAITASSQLWEEDKVSFGAGEAEIISNKCRNTHASENVLVFLQVGLDDYIFESKITPTTSWAAKYFRYQRFSGAHSGYRVALLTGSNSITLGRFDAGSYTELDAASVVLNGNVEYTVRVELRGDNIDVYLNDQLTLQAVDGTHKLTEVGFLIDDVAGNQGAIDDVSIRSVAEVIVPTAQPAMLFHAF